MLGLEKPINTITGNFGEGFYTQTDLDTVGSGMFLGDQAYLLDHGTNGVGYYSNFVTTMDYQEATTDLTSIYRF